MRASVWFRSAVAIATGTFSFQGAFASDSLWQASVQHRSRIEFVDGSLSGRLDDTAALYGARTSLQVGYDDRSWFFQAEVTDARVDALSNEVRLNTALVNTFEPTQFLVGARLQQAGAEPAEFRAGIQTINVGSRRLVARNLWRNTTNTFLGFHARIPHANGGQTTAFAVSPLQRLPGDQAALRNSAFDLDEASLERRFLGLAHRFSGAPFDAYLLHLNEGDEPDAQTRNRRLWTLGARWKQPKNDLGWDVEVEGAAQWGKSRASGSAADLNDLDHRAAFFHGGVGRTFSGPLSWRVAMELDFASGDKNPNDGDEGGFEALYGAAVFDLGVRGLWSLLPRRNLVLAGPRLDVKRGKTMSARLRVRQAWLHEADGRTGAVGPMAAGKTRADCRVNWNCAGARPSRGGRCAAAGPASGPVTTSSAAEAPTTCGCRRRSR